MTLTDLSDEELLSRLADINMEGRRLLARMILLLIEVEDRRLDLKTACTSLFDFCVRRLGLSESAAFRRMTAAQLVRRFPRLLEHVESGAIHLSTLVLLRDHLTEQNLDELVAEASGKRKREVEELIARRAPRPDAPSKIQKLPLSKRAANAADGTLSLASPGAVATPSQARIEPLSEARHKLQVTIDTDVREMLERARDLMRHRNPSGDLAVVVRRALETLLEKLEKERLATTTRPRKSDATRAAKSGRVPAAVRRAVFERDGEQCTFVDHEGRRCPARGFLELDHIESRALGGGNELENLRCRCRRHNGLHAEEVFGREHVARRIHFRQRKLASAVEPAHETLEVVARGLVNMGFRPKEARRAIEAIARQHGPAIPSVGLDDLLRQALAVLT